MESTDNTLLRVRGRPHIQALTILDLVADIDALHQDAAWLHDGCSARTLNRGTELSTVLFVMKSGHRIGVDRARGGVALHVVAGRLEVHIGDEWDQLPYPIRHTEGACSFFALYDHSIELSAGSLLQLDPAWPHDIEALEDSAFILDICAEPMAM